MQYIDWIISATIFLMTIVVVFSIIPQNLPLQDNSVDLFTAENVYNNIQKDLDVYIFNSANTKNTSTANSYIIDENINGSIGSYFIQDGNKVYTTYLNKSIVFNKEDNNQNNNIGINILNESFEDHNYLDSFSLVDGNTPNLHYDALELINTTKIQTREKYFDFNNSLQTNCFDLNIYFNYADSNNYNLLEISDSTQNLISCIENSCSIEDTKNIIKNADWRKIYFGSTYDNNIVGIIGNQILEQSLDVDLNKGSIIIENVNNSCIIDDFKVYKNYDINVNADINNIQTNYFDVNVNNNILSLDILDNRRKIGNLDINSENNLVFEENNKNIKLLKDDSNISRLVIYPNTPEIWFNINSGEDLNINASDLDLNTLPYYIEDTNEEFNIWTKVDLPANSTKTIYLSKINGSDANGDAVFEFFDDFEGTAINSNDWNKIWGDFNVENGHLNIAFNTSTFILNKNIQDEEYIIETKIKSIQNGDTQAHPGIAYNSNYITTQNDLNADKTYFRPHQTATWNIQSSYFTDGVHTMINDTTPEPTEPYVWDYWNKIKLLKKSALVDTYLNGYLSYEESNPRYNDNYFAINPGSKGQNFYDYVFVRQYTANEPTVTITDLENGLYKVDITNNESNDLNNYQVRIPNTSISVNSKDQKLQLIDSEDLENNHLLVLNDFKVNKNTDSNCNISYSSGNININNCLEDSIISLEIINEDNVNYLETPIVNNFIKSKQGFIFEDDLLDLNINNDYYINILNKSLDQNFGINRKINTNILERYSTFINSNGEKENTKILIKPY